MDSARYHAFRIVFEFETFNLQLKSIRNAYYKKNNIASNDRKRAMVLSNEVIRWKKYLDALIAPSLNKSINKLPLEILCILRLGYYEFFMDESVPDHAVVNSWVNISKKVKKTNFSGLVNAVLRKAKKIEKQTILKSKDLAIQKSFSRWMVDNWSAQFGDLKTRQLLDHLNKPSLQDIRTNIPMDVLKEKLDQLGVEFHKSPFSQNFLRIDSGLGKIISSSIHVNGEVFIQDRASGAIVELLNPKKGDVVLDVCAAPGTKSIYIYHKTKESAKVYSSDINKSLVLKAKQRCKDLSLPISWQLKDATKDEFPNADRILIDAPCTGTGVISKRPDIKWRRKKGDSKKMSFYQMKILQHMSGFLKPNGILVYSTCSLEYQENWNVVSSFLKLNSNYKLESAESFVPKKWINEQNCFETFPPRDNVDGMFAARIRRC